MYFPSDYENEQTRVVYDDPYTVTLIAVDNNMTTDDDNEIGDFTSTLEVILIMELILPVEYFKTLFIYSSI